MPTTTATIGPAMKWSGLLDVPTVWDAQLQDVIQSIKLGIEQARRNEGTELTDSDLQTDDDD